MFPRRNHMFWVGDAGYPRFHFIRKAKWSGFWKLWFLEQLLRTSSDSGLQVCQHRSKSEQSLSGILPEIGRFGSFPDTFRRFLSVFLSFLDGFRHFLCVFSTFGTKNRTETENPFRSMFVKIPCLFPMLFFNNKHNSDRHAGRIR